jgi:hypothetical protein
MRRRLLESCFLGLVCLVGGFDDSDLKNTEMLMDESTKETKEKVGEDVLV